MPSHDLATIEAELREVEATIDAAYWTFTRTKRGKPPALVVPEAYRRRTELRAAMAELRRRTNSAKGAP